MGIMGVGEYASKATSQVDPNCTFCKKALRPDQIESPEHAFFYCPTVQNIINQLREWEPFKILDCSLEAFEVLIWTRGTSKQHEATVNSAMIWLKHYLFTNIFRKTMPTAKGAKNFITYHAQDIDWTLKMKNKISDYDIFWNPGSYIKLEKGYTKDYSVAEQPFPSSCILDPMNILNSQ